MKGILRMYKRTDICDCRVAFATEIVIKSFTYLCHRHNDLNVEGNGSRGHDDYQRLARQHGEQDAPHGLTKIFSMTQKYLPTTVPDP